MLNERTQTLPQDEQHALVSLWNALGLSYQSHGDSQSHKKQINDAGDGLALLDHEVLVHYQLDGRFDSNYYVDKERRQLRHSVDDKCQYRKMGMSSYGQAVLQDISISGLRISICRKLDLNSTITVLVETDNPTHLPLLIHAKVVRDAGMTNDSLYHYGCEIERIIDPNL